MYQCQCMDYITAVLVILWWNKSHRVFIHMSGHMIGFLNSLHMWFCVMFQTWRGCHTDAFQFWHTCFLFLCLHQFILVSETSNLFPLIILVASIHCSYLFSGWSEFLNWFQLQLVFFIQCMWLTIHNNRLLNLYTSLFIGFFSGVLVVLKKWILNTSASENRRV